MSRRRRLICLKENEVIKENPFAMEEIVEEIIEDIIETTDREEKEDIRVVCVNTKEVFEDNKDASEKTGVNAGAIKRCCEGETKSAGKDEEGNKLVWKYLKDM